MSKNAIVRSIVFVALVGLGVAGRLLEHTPNMTPMAAAALFAAFYFHRWWTAALVPLSATAISDFFLGGYEWSIMLTVYGAWFLALALRPLLYGKLSPVRIGIGAGGFSLAFYLVSNLGVWYSWYPHSLAGLGQCYVAALPFLKNALTGDLLWSGILFGGFSLTMNLLPRFRKATAKLLQTPMLKP